MKQNSNIYKKEMAIFTIDVLEIVKYLFYFMLFIILCFLLGQGAKFIFGFDYLLGFVPMFDLYLEGNIPTWFSSFILLAAAILLSVIAMTKRRQSDRYFLHWAGLSVIFLYLSADEAAQLHETIGGVFFKLAGPSLVGENWSMWVVPFGIALLIIGGLYIRFVFGLAPYFRNLFVLSGVVYVSGALGMEVVEILYALSPEASDEIFMTLVVIEESMEMGGILLFIYGLLKFIEKNMGTISVGFRSADNGAG